MELTLWVEKRGSAKVADNVRGVWTMMVVHVTHCTSLVFEDA